MTSFSSGSLEFVTEFDEQHSLMVVECRGILTKDSAITMISKIKDIQTKVNRGEPGNFHRLYDFGPTLFELSVSEFADIIDRGRSLFSVQGQKHRVALVTQDPFALDILSLYKSTSSRYSYNVLEYFPNRDEALQWLTK